MWEFKEGQKENLLIDRAPEPLGLEAIEAYLVCRSTLNALSNTKSVDCNVPDHLKVQVLN